MKYLKLFDNHSGYTEYMSGEAILPNVSHCILEDEVHYNPELPSVLPGNEEAWALYSSLVCDSERLDRDLKNIFSKYQVSMTNPYTYYFKRFQDVLYIDEGVRFTYTDGTDTYNCDIFTYRTALNSSYAVSPVTNDCGQNVLPEGVGQWEIEQVSPGIFS